MLDRVAVGFFPGSRSIVQVIIAPSILPTYAFVVVGRAHARVPTRSVRKYTLLRRRPEASGAREAVEGGSGHAGELGDGGLGDAELEEAPDVVLLAVEP